jgi:hypothetical protein
MLQIDAGQQQSVMATSVPEQQDRHQNSNQDLPMIPDFKGHHFLEEFKPDQPPAGHYCERCGMKAALTPDGSAYFEVDRRRIFHKPGDRIPLTALPVPPCNVARPRPA